MIDPAEKSTEVPAAAGCAEITPGIFLDGRLAIVHPGQGWLAVSDLHFGYEIRRRAAGGLWPLWGMQSIEERLRELIDHWKPDVVILNGDIVDGSAAPVQAIHWLSSLSDLGPEIVLIEGNHDRGEVRRKFDFRPSWQVEEFFFHHGHRSGAGLTKPVAGLVEVTGHLHPSVSFADGAGRPGCSKKAAGCGLRPMAR